MQLKGGFGSDPNRQIVWKFQATHKQHLLHRRQRTVPIILTIMRIPEGVSVIHKSKDSS